MREVFLGILSDEASRKILNSTICKAKSVEEIICEIQVPISTVCRRVHELTDAGALFVEAAVATEEGYCHCLYRSRFRGIKAELNPGGLRLRGALNDCELLTPLAIDRLLAVG
jgi:hypothetical protein